MIDIHTHIVPGLDDGSYDMETSIIMAEMAEEFGTDTIIATPHCNQVGRFENYISDKLISRLEAFRDEIARENIDLEIGFGMEIYCTEDVPKLLKEKKLLTLNGSRYALVEFGFRTDADKMESMLYPIADSGYVPIVAHPERYFALYDQPEIIEDWLDDGIGIQLNSGSVFGVFGRSAARFSRFLLDNDLVTCIASDAHGTESRNMDLSEIYDFLSMEYSEEKAELLLTENPRRIYNNMQLIKSRNIQLY